MCVSWDLSRTYPPSLSDNWDLVPCPRFSPAICRVVQVSSFGDSLSIGAQSSDPLLIPGGPPLLL